MNHDPTPPSSPSSFRLRAHIPDATTIGDVARGRAIREARTQPELSDGEIILAASRAAHEALTARVAELTDPARWLSDWR